MTDPQSPADTGRRIELDVEVPGTPEEVWEAIATGPGISSWFVPMEVEEHAGGRAAIDFGEFGTDDATVTAWEPPHRVVFESTGERALAYEWLVEARDGGTCVVRLVNSGFGSGADWDGDYHGMSEGWKIFLENLRLQLTNFRGRSARAVIPTVMVPGPNRPAWESLCDVLGIRPDISEGERVETGADAPALAGVVEKRMTSPAATAVLLVLDAPAPGTAFVTVEGDGETVAASVYLYLYGAAPGVGDEWKQWLAERFPAPSTPVDA